MNEATFKLRIADGDKNAVPTTATTVSDGDTAPPLLPSMKIFKLNDFPYQLGVLAYIIYVTVYVTDIGILYVVYVRMFLRACDVTDCLL